MLRKRRALTQLLDMQGSLVELNRALADRIARGEADLQTPGLSDHLCRPRWQARGRSTELCVV